MGLHILKLTYRTPGSVRVHSYRLYSYRFPAYVNVSCLSILLMLSGDIALNPGPVNLGSVYSHSIRNKGPLISDTIVSNNLDILALAETNIQLSDTDSLLKSVTPPGFRLTHRPRTTGRGGGVGFLTKSYPQRLLIPIRLSKMLSHLLPPCQNLLWLPVSCLHQVHVPLLLLDDFISYSFLCYLWLFQHSRGYRLYRPTEISKHAG